VLFWLIYLLTYSNTERALPGIADDGLVSIVWCKHGFRRRRSNFDEKFVRFKDCGTKLHITEFLNKGWGLRGLYKLLKKKLLETGTTAIDEAATLKAYKISLVFLFCNSRTQTGYYNIRIMRLVANFLSCNITVATVRTGTYSDAAAARAVSMVRRRVPRCSSRMPSP